MKLSEDNYHHKVFKFRDRQAGVSVIYDPHSETYTYNAYCLEIKLMKELFTVEHDFLSDAITMINEEFGTWELIDLDDKGCGSCSAK